MKKFINSGVYDLCIKLDAIEVVKLSRRNVENNIWGVSVWLTSDKGEMVMFTGTKYDADTYYNNLMAQLEG